MTFTNEMDVKHLAKIRQAKALLISSLNKKHSTDIPVLEAIDWLNIADKHISFHIKDNELHVKNLNG